MAACSLLVESPRELLSQAIIDAIRSFPETHRRIFVQVRYEGRRVEDAAIALGISETEARQILQQCERKLIRNLREFRHITGFSGFQTRFLHL